MIGKFFQALIHPIGEQDVKYWHDGYFIRVFKEQHGYGWQVYRNDKFTFRDGQFVDLIDGGLCEFQNDAYTSAEEYIENVLYSRTNYGR
ncbi:hypothetical protein QUA41_30665 [Microcoleus sp. Pol11C1]|uniref:hypothetical protein n=1 Tax=unclassified Microcoleus TaxID=2642155 RepID=UPI002FD71E08